MLDMIEFYDLIQFYLFLLYCSEIATAIKPYLIIPILLSYNYLYLPCFISPFLFLNLFS